jgi:hypothetical protein
VAIEAEEAVPLEVAAEGDEVFPVRGAARVGSAGFLLLFERLEAFLEVLDLLVPV